MDPLATFNSHDQAVFRGAWPGRDGYVATVTIIIDRSLNQTHPRPKKLPEQRPFGISSLNIHPPKDERREKGGQKLRNNPEPVRLANGPWDTHATQREI